MSLQQHHDSVYHFVSLDNLFVKFDHKSGALMPVSADFGREVSTHKHRLHNACHESSAIQGTWKKRLLNFKYFLGTYG